MGHSGLLSASFNLRNGELFCEQVPLAKLTQKFGTPLFVISSAHLRRQIAALNRAFRHNGSYQNHYAMKAWPSLWFLHDLASQGEGVNVDSGGELAWAFKAGVDPSKVIYSGPGKTASELRQAIKAQVGMLVAESIQEVRLVSRLAHSMGLACRLGIRVLPDIPAGGHQAIETGGREHKFGIFRDEVEEVFAEARELPGLNVCGIQMHIGSQILLPENCERLVRATRELAQIHRQLQAQGFELTEFDIGGGLGIPYRFTESELDLKKLATQLLPLIPSDCRLHTENGRFIVGNAAILVTTVQYVKYNPLLDGSRKWFVICDADMTENIRPALYGSYHEIVPCKVDHFNPDIIEADIVGPVCESDGFLGKNRRIPMPKPDDVLAILTAGAYCQAMASNYNLRRRAAEVLVSGEDYWKIRRRETVKDLWQTQIIPPRTKEQPLPF